MSRLKVILFKGSIKGRRRLVTKENKWDNERKDNDIIKMKGDIQRFK